MERRHRELREALEDPAARQRLAGDDPTRLFALLATRPVPDAVLDAVSREVAAGIRREGRRPGASRWLAWGGVAAGLLLAATLAVPLYRPLGPPATVVVDSGGGAWADPVTPQETLPGREGLQLTLAGDARPQVFDLAVGDVQVVMIFDEGLEL